MKTKYQVLESIILAGINTRTFILYIFIVMTGVFLLSGCRGKRPFVDNTPPESLVYLTDSSGLFLEVEFKRGRYHNHPLMVFWLEEET